MSRLQELKRDRDASFHALARTSSLTLLGESAPPITTTKPQTPHNGTSPSEACFHSGLWHSTRSASAETLSMQPPPPPPPTTTTVSLEHVFGRRNTFANIDGEGEYIFARFMPTGSSHRNRGLVVYKDCVCDSNILGEVIVDDDTTIEQLARMIESVSFHFLFPFPPSSKFHFSNFGGVKIKKMYLRNRN